MPPPLKKNPPPDLSRGSDIPRGFDGQTGACDHLRREVMVPMRDGVKLFTVICIPRSPSGRKRHPILLTRTPYGAKGRTARKESPKLAMRLSAADAELVERGTILVYQDIRGRHQSEGKFVMMRPVRGPFNRGKVDEVTDAWDTVDWLVREVPESNGKVGITGLSYDGMLALMALLNPHPAVKAVAPVNPMVDSWIGDDVYHLGALRALMFEWIYQLTATKGSGKVSWGYHDLYQAYLDAGSAGRLGARYGGDRLPAWKRFLSHPAYDAYWQDQSLVHQLERIRNKIPVLSVHSLFDPEDSYGALASHAVLASQDRRGDRTFLAIGPWTHGQTQREGSSLGGLRWGADTALQFREEIWHPFWDRYLRGDKTQKLPKVRAFETGSHTWRTLPSWPPRRGGREIRLFLEPHGRLAIGGKPGQSGVSAFVSDPAKPVPFRVRPIRAPFSQAYDAWLAWLADDQRPFADRPDVLSFVSEPLKTPLVARGEVMAHLSASTTGTDVDWVVKLIDVFPEEVPDQPSLGGWQMMISSEIFRGRYRESLSQPKPVPSGEILPYHIPLPQVNHCFRKGHRILVQVQSTWFPLYDRNPQTYVENIAWARDEDYVQATHRIHHGKQQPSYLELRCFGR